MTAIRRYQGVTASAGGLRPDGLVGVNVGGRKTDALLSAIPGLLTIESGYRVDHSPLLTPRAIIVDGVL